eukprot:COSAG06_NODE_285_length_18323_cov_93.673672_8_plen_88_part_00
MAREEDERKRSRTVLKWAFEPDLLNTRVVRVRCLLGVLHHEFCLPACRVLVDCDQVLVAVPTPVNISTTACQIQTGWSPRSERSFER